MPRLDKFAAWMYRWLPIVFGCHCRPERSLFLGGRKFPICARCTGELAGILTGMVCCFFFRPSVWICVILMLPMILDGLVQQLTSYESTNVKRLLTGTLFGFGSWMIFVISVSAVFWLGVQLGESRKA